MKIDLTQISSGVWNSLAYNDYTPNDIIKNLNDKSCNRSMFDILKRFRPNLDISECLISFFTELNDKVKQGSVVKKVGNWLSGRNTPRRDDIFKICFALELDINEASYLIKHITGNDIHYRNAVEFVYAYCLYKKQSFAHALDIISQINSECMEDVYIPDIYTNIRSVDYITDDSSLIDFINSNPSYWGTIHNYAYKYYMDFCSILISPTADEKAYSIESIMDNYIKMQVPSDKAIGKFNALQKLIKHCWPNSKNIKLMRLRKEDITREILIILYIITDGVSANSTAYDELDESYISDMEKMEEHCWRINLMLKQCGMALLDPRRSFDYIVLYSLKTNDTDFMSERLEALITEIFEDKSEQCMQ